MVDDPRPKQSRRRLPIAPDSHAATVAMFHVQRVATADALARGRSAEDVLGIARDAHAFAQGSMELARTLRPLACDKGCSYCCYVNVAASAVEAFLVAAHVTERLDSAAVQAVGAELARVDVATTDVATEDRLGLKIGCAFLDGAGSCGVYEARPMPCRGWNSFDADACRRSFDKGDATSAIPASAARMTAASAVAFALFTGLRDAGLDGRPVRLVSAVRAALADPAWPSRWAAGERMPDALIDVSTEAEWASNEFPPLAASAAFVAASAAPR